MGAQATEALVALARDEALTVNTLLLGAWSLLLGKLSGRDQVTFGMTVSGRPSEVTHIGEAVGLFINTVPVVVQHDRSQSLGSWLAQLQHGQNERLAHTDLPLQTIQGQRPGEHLFDHLLVFENYPVTKP